jgi:anti-repressor protein
MKELIAVQLTNIGNEEVNAVSARDLHKHLESKQDFSTWITARIERYEFAEGVDFTSFHKIVEREIGATKQIEYIISLDMAKELSMVENNVKGKEARKYFIECEKATKKPMSQFEIIAQIALAPVAMEKRQLALEQEMKPCQLK